MDASERLELNSPQVVDEVIDGEVMIIHLGTGHYYNLQDAGAQVWQLLRAGHPSAEIVRIISRRFSGEASPIASGVVSFLDRVVEEGLVRRTDAAAPAPAAAAEEPGAARPPFVPPELNKYLDMQQLIALDPIHETDEQGWPRADKDTA